MSSNVDQAFITKFKSELTHAFQTEGSRLRDCVWVDSNVVGNKLRFPVLSASTATKNRARHTILSGDPDAHSYKEADIQNYEDWKFIDNLDRFKTNIDLRKGYAMALGKSMGRAVDLEITTALNASNTSAGSAAALDKALLVKIGKLANENNWPTGKWTWVITPAVYEKLMTVTEVLSRDFGSGTAFVNGKAGTVMNFSFVVLPALADIKVSATEHKTFAFHQEAVGLGFASDINSRIDYSAAHASDIVYASGAFGAVSILPEGVLRVNVNGL
jgi:hypothetical protein